MSSLTSKDYDIAGNQFRAFYDANSNLVFVIDYTTDDRKPNVLLVINQIGERKWDDVLANDYDVDLETVRPKKDNKYQKLDIEYTGLAEYDELIRQYETGTDFSDALDALSRFRDASIRRTATRRLSAATTIADKSRDTIVKTNESISELQTRIKQLRTKLNQQKKSIGREPTKQSAAKILRTESQIDATNEKLRRAKKRLANAQRRLVAADADAEIAREILEHSPAANDVNVDADKKSALPAARAPRDLMATTPAPVPATTKTEFTEDTTDQQPKAEIMADEEVKPLFDKDPEILDEEIAFKPIDFDVPNTNSNMSNVMGDEYVSEGSSVVAPAPLSFTPPTPKVASDATAANEVPVEFRPITDVPNQSTQPQPVLDTITSVDVPVSADMVMPTENKISDDMRPAPVMPDVPPMQNNAAPEIAPAPVSSDLRPVSPISGAAPVVASDGGQRRPTFLYYIMLLALIALSVFTLWLYQKKSATNVPDLTTVAPAPHVAVPPQTDTANSPFIAPVETADDMATAETVEITVPTPVAESEPVVVVPEPEPEPVPVSAPAPQDATPVAEPVPEPVPVVAEPEPVAVVPEPTETEVPSPFITTPKPVVASEEDIITSKPAYNVSQQENMFVAAPDYETDATYYEEDTSDVGTCEGGASPDANGCCPGEVFTDMENGTFACCTSDGVECFPPMK